MRLDPNRFEKLVITLIKDPPSGSFMGFICNIPRLIERGKSLYGDLRATQELTREVMAAYLALTSARHALKKLLDTRAAPRSFSRVRNLRDYAFILTLCSIYYCMLRGFKKVQNGPADEGNELVKATLDLAKDVEDLSPLGSMYMLLPLFAVCLATEDAKAMALVKTAIWNLEKHYHRSVQIDAMVQRMEELRLDLHIHRDGSSIAGSDPS